MTVAACAQCKTLTHDARIYMIHEEGSVSGGITWMCPPCLIERRGLPVEVAEAVAYTVAADAISQAMSDRVGAVSSAEEERERWRAYLTHCSECRGCRDTADGCPRAEVLHDAWKAATRVVRETSRASR